MVKKLVYELSEAYNKDVKEDAIPLDLNNDLHNLLKKQKDFISEHFWTKKWDKYKKFANDYELIFTSGYGYPSISSHTPISRSYFKLWEILKDFEDDMFVGLPQPNKCLFLAEGPGGFVEAYCNYRNKKYTTKEDKLYGITLLSSDKNIPTWKLSQDLQKNNNVQLLRGKDGTGSLYCHENIESYISTIGRNTCNLITADGGFDFSNDFNNQEELSTRLILSEIFTCLQLQKYNGVFLLKIYDIHAITTIQLLYILKEMYHSIVFIKPLSSRPANSEKYVLCKGFKGNSHPNYIEYVKLLDHTIKTWDEKNHIKLSVPMDFVKDIVEFNACYIMNQVMHINKTLCFIYMMKNEKTDEMFVQNLRTQLRKAIKWCNKYNVPISVNALKVYQSVYLSDKPKHEVT